MAQNRLEQRMILDLLDDQCPLKISHLNWAPPQITAPTRSASSLASPSTLASSVTKVAATPNKSQKKSKEKIIRAQRTLRSMMSEYNRPSPSLFRNPVRKDGGGLQSERVEHIQLPDIPGKILRPE
jgi:hypothetical protein